MEAPDAWVKNAIVENFIQKLWDHLFIVYPKINIKKDEESNHPNSSEQNLYNIQSSPPSLPSAPPVGAVACADDRNEAIA